MRDGILPSTLKIVLKTRYPLPQQQPGPVSPPLGVQPYSSPLPCAEPESSGDDEIESGNLKALADSQEEEQWKISPAAWPDDMSENHQE